MRHEKEYWIFADESVQEGRHFSNFFGGCIIPARQHAAVENRLRIHKAKIGFLKELKWQRVSEMWLEGYQRMITHFFDELRAGHVRMRTRLRLFFDQFPHTREQVAQFKGFIAGLPVSKELRHKNLKIDSSHITEVDSKEHVLLQCVDIVLGAMAFR